MSAHRVLVTGATGVIGAWVVRQIAEAGDTPIALSRGTTDVGRRILGELANEIEWISCDIRDPLALMSAVYRAAPDVIAHLASAKPWQMDAGYVPNPNPPLGVEAIINGSTNMLEIARVLGVGRVVFASSKSAYAPFVGDYASPTYLPVPETYPSNPIEVYGITKLAAEQLGGYYRKHLGVDVIALRFASTYGPFKRGGGTAPAGLIGAAVEGLQMEAMFERATYETQLDDLVYNRDVARAFQLATAVEQTKDWLFNIGMGFGSSIHDVVDAIAAVPAATTPDVSIVPDGTPGAGKGHLVQTHAGVLDVSAAKEQLGFVAEYDLVAGITDAAEVVAQSRELARA